ncbi:MBL fold metallo-hydrolase [Lysinibacillus sp. KU-BSD001]|uniref:ComEC/Rec2 family competence protein n=1 Tax=Lysinibacillus sp. KU-BSD001 TaxID=3141328 RepID=UPI0036E8EC5A
MKKILLLLLTGLILTSCSSTSNNTPPLSLYIFKIGKADSILISYNDHHILIDAGEDDDGEEILNYLKVNQIKKLDALIITHFDKDHVGGADQIVENVEIDAVYTANYESDSKQTTKFMATMTNKGLEPIKLTEMIEIILDDQTLTLYPAENTAYNGDNDYSIVATLDYNKISMLFAGDAEQARLRELLRNADLARPFDLVKMPHHGRYHELTEAFIETIHPTYAVITSSDKNVEDIRTVTALEGIGAEVYVTRNGDIQVATDGETLVIQQ